MISRKELIRRTAEFFGDKPAVVYEKQTLSFKEVDERANRLANALIGLGLKKGDRVATLMRNCLQYPEIEFALFKGGFAQVILNPRLPAADQLFQISDSGASAVIVQHLHGELLRPIRDQLKTVKHFICFDGKAPDMADYDRLLSSAASSEPEGELEPDDIGEIRYTSGTTGVPKGIILPYRSRLAITRNFLMDHLGDMTANDRFLALQPLYHGAGWFILGVWVRGVTHYIVPTYGPEIAFDLIEREKITFVKTVPTVLIRLLDSPDIRQRRLSSVRTIIYGGSPMPVERLKEAIGIFGPVFINLYGQMEAPMTITWLRKEEHVGELMGSVGRPCTFVEVKVVNDQGSQVQPGEIGEIILRGDHQMVGYLNRPEANAETIHDGWIYTRDLGTVNRQGFVYLTGGRKSEMIKSGGLLVYPAEVERILYQHPAVAEVGVIGVPHPEWGETVKACVVLKEGQRVSEQELIAFCKERLASYKTPKSVEFVEELPHNAAGKVMYGELRKRYR